MKKILLLVAIFVVLIFLLTQGIAATGTALLELDCTANADTYGFVNLQATAGYEYQGFLYCANVDVYVKDQAGEEYAMYGGFETNCVYSKLIQLPQGTQTVTFRAVYPDTEETDSCNVNVQYMAKPSLIIYAPEYDQEIQEGTGIYVEAVAVSEGQNLKEGTLTVELEGTEVELEPNAITGAYKTDIDTTGLVPGNYTMHFSLDIYSWNVKKDVPIKIVTQPGQQPGPSEGLILTIVSPQMAVYTENSTVPLQVMVKDTNGLIVSGVDVTTEIYKNWEKEDDVDLTEHRYYYTGSYTFEEAAAYTVTFKASKGALSAEKNVSFEVGQLLVTPKFNVTIIIPQSTVYSENAQFLARAQVTDDDVPIQDAEVKLVLNGEEYYMEYDRYGEYVVEVGPLPEAQYTLSVFAKKDDKVGQDQVEFAVSKHRLNIILLKPNIDKAIEIKKGEPVTISMDLLDEHGDIVSKSQVIVEVQEPGGRLSEMQVFQTPEGDYTTIFYISEEGAHSFTLRAAKPGFIADQFDATFVIELEQVGIIIFGWELETLLNIILIVAIIILVAGLLRAVL